MNKKALLVFSVVIIAIVLALYFLLFRKPATLRILAEDVSTTRAIRDETLKVYSPAMHPKFDLMAYDEMVQKANLDLASGTGVYDIILQYNTALANYIRNKYIVSLSEMRKRFPDRVRQGTFPFEKDLFPKCWKEIGWYKDQWGSGTGEEPYGIPFSANTMIMAYNRELFSNEAYKKEYKERYKTDLVPPRNWQEFKQIANYFNKPNQGIYGICLQGAPYFIYYEWANLAYSLGGGLMKKTWGWEGDENTQLLLNAPATIEATRLYTDLKQYDASEDFFKTDAVTQVQILKKKKIALALVWSDVVYSLAYENGKPLRLYDFAPIPGEVSMLAGGAFYINRRAKSIETAMEFVLNQMNKEKQIALMKIGLCSPLRSVYDTVEVRQIPYANALKISLDRGVYMLEAGPDADAVITILSDALQNLMKDPKGKERVADVLNQAQQEIQKKRSEIFRYLSEKGVQK
jgi:multiple sugar transport system substrate-binding protein